MKLDLILKDIQDVYSRENFTRLLRFFKSIDLLGGEFQFFEVEINQANTIYKLAHGLNFIPQDIIFVSVEGDYNFYFRYAEFDKTNISIFVSGPCKLRFFAGSFKDPAYGRKVGDYTLVPPNGATGTGTTWFTGTGVPPGGLGSIGDFYLDVSSKDVYLKTGASVWTLEGNISSTHPASSITLDTSITANTLSGATVQDYFNRAYDPDASEKPTYNGDGTVNFVEFFGSSTQTTPNRTYRVDFTYDADLQPLTEVWKAYSLADGTTVLKTVSLSYTWVSGQLTNKTQVTT